MLICSLERFNLLRTFQIKNEIFNRFLASQNLEVVRVAHTRASFLACFEIYHQGLEEASTHEDSHPLPRVQCPSFPWSW
jgi:hypothetical protein